MSGRWGIPNGWSWSRIGEIAEVIGGGTPATSDSENFSDNEVPWLTPADLSGYDGTYISRGRRDISRKGLADSGAKLLPKGSVLFSSRAPIGYCVIAENELSTNQGFKSLVLRDGMSPEYMRYYLLASRDYAESLASGTTFKELSGKKMADMVIPVPPLDVQRRIVAKLDELLAQSRAAREQLQAVPALVEQYRQSVLAAAFRGDLTADWRKKNPDVEPASKLLERIRIERRQKWEAAELAKLKAKGKSPKDDKWKSKYLAPNEPDEPTVRRELPASWTIASVDDVSECLDSIRQPVKRDDRQNVEQKYPYYGANGQVGMIDKFLFDEELVLVTEDETFYGRTKPIAYRVSGRCWVNNHAHVLRAAPQLAIEYLHRVLMHYPVHPWLSGSTGRAKLTQAAMKSLPVALPPSAEMKVLIPRLERALRACDELGESLVSLGDETGTIERSLLAKAFRGELVT